MTIKNDVTPWDLFAAQALRGLLTQDAARTLRSFDYSDGQFSKGEVDFIWKLVNLAAVLADQMVYTRNVIEEHGDGILKPEKLEPRPEPEPTPIELTAHEAAEPSASEAAFDRAIEEAEASVEEEETYPIPSEPVDPESVIDSVSASPMFV